jgi:hypothetical protein
MVTSKKKELTPIKRRIVTVRLVGTSPLIEHRWDEKAKEMMRQKQQTGKKTKDRQLRDPDEEGEAAMYRTADGKPGVLAVAIKAAVIEAAHQDLGIPKTLVRKALFIRPMGREVILEIEPSSGSGKVDYVIEEDMVRVGQGSADLRYRPYFYDWAVTTEWEIDADLLKDEDLLTLVDRAGFGVGIHEWRPEKGGEFGRFQIDTNFAIQTQDV